MISGVVIAACVLATCCVYGNEWWREDDQGTHLNQETLDYVRPPGFQHPPFQCPDMSPSPTVPTSVEHVKAADIKVIAALGDSLTTAVGANGTSIVSVPFEYRQVSWSIGGYGTYRDVITLANIVKLFNPSVLGPAPKALLHDNPIKPTINDTGFCFAITGHNTLNMSEQVRHMIDTFKSYPGLNFKEDWKLVTVLIGMNDICDHCKNKSLFSADNFIHFMTESLDMMMNEIPRMIVNVVQHIPMEGLREVFKPTLGCQLQRQFCSCLIVPKNSTELQEVLDTNLEFQRRLQELLLSDRFFKKDFAVVLQPYLQYAQPPRLENGDIDHSYFTADCFHFSVKGHEELAKGLWNNMFQPEGEKAMVYNISQAIELICPPKEHPYIYTRPRVLSAGHPLNHTSMTMFTLLLLLIGLFYD